MPSSPTCTRSGTTASCSHRRSPSAAARSPSSATSSASSSSVCPGNPGSTADRRPERRGLMTDIASIAADLAAEQQSLDDVVAGLTPEQLATARKSVVQGKSVSVRVDLGGRRHLIKKHLHLDILSII